MSGGGSSGGGGTSTSTSIQELSPEQKQILGFTTPVFQSYFGPNGQVNAQPYSGKTLADTSPLQTLGQSMALSTAQGPAQGAVDATLKGTNFLTSGAALDPNTNPGLKGTLDAATRQLTDNFTQSIMPAIRDDAVLAGGYGGSGQGIASGIAAKGLEQQVGDTSAQLLAQNYQSGLDAMAKGLAFAPSNISAAFTPATAVSGVGDVQQQQQQQAINDAINNYYTKTFFPLQLAEEIAGVSMGMPGGAASTSSKYGSTGGGSTLNNVMSGIAGGGSLLASFLPYLLS